MILSLGAPLHKAHKEHLNRVLPNRFYEIYGVTEGFITLLDRADAVRKAGSVGVPPPFYDMRIVDEEGRDCAPGQVGEIVGRGPITMAGYVNRDDLTVQTIRNGWVHTGDLGHVDEEGFLYLVDRKKDMIDSGGVKVYPKDIAEIAVQHAAVHEVAVFGIPHDKWGETPVAAVVLRAGANASEEELRDWINSVAVAISVARVSSWPTFRETRRVRRSNGRCGSPIGLVANGKYDMHRKSGTNLPNQGGPSMSALPGHFKPQLCSAIASAWASMCRDLFVQVTVVIHLTSTLPRQIHDWRRRIGRHACPYGDP
jgi:acyl-CoA synthetase (AMP-forming)/AMP-acid ligase II